ncbi:MAG: leucine-rich repeat protein [Mycoplasmataceae bacterium]|nr:leucine-rich repeat protein [Mycoplasmataceae bacterium]
MKKFFLSSLLTIISAGTICGIALSVNAIENLNNLKNSNKINEENEQTTNLKKITETILTADIVRELSWDKKTSITLSDWVVVPNVTIIDSLAFYQNSILTLIEFPSSITHIGDSSFLFNNALQTVRFEEKSNLREIGSQAFSNSVIDLIDIPSSVEIIGQAAFIDTRSLKSVTFQENSKINSINSDAFKGSSLESIIFPNKDFIIEDTAFKNTTLLTNIVAKYTLKQNSTISKYGFTQNQWDNIKWIYSPTESSIITLDVLNSIGWDEKLDITLNDWSTMAPNAHQIESAFLNHKFLEKIDIPKNIINISADSFAGNTKLLSIKMPNVFKRLEPNFGFTSEQWNNIVWFEPGTVLLRGNFNISEVSNILSSNFNESKIKQIIINDLIKYAPSNFSDSNIILENLMTNNLKGEISFSASINKYFDDNLVEQTIGFTPVPITFIGFKKIIPNLIIEKEYLVENMSHSNPSNYTDKEIIDFLKLKITGDTPDNFEIKIINKSTKDNNGKIIVKIEMINYYNSNGDIDSNSSPVFSLALNGFGVVKNYMPILISLLSISVVVLMINGFSIFKILEKEKQNS